MKVCSIHYYIFSYLEVYNSLVWVEQAANASTIPLYDGRFTPDQCKTTMAESIFPPSSPPTTLSKLHSPYHYFFPFFLSGHLPGLFICSFHLPRLSPGSLIYSAPTAPLGQTWAAAPLTALSQRPVCSYRYGVTDKDREWLFQKAPRHKR